MKFNFKILTVALLLLTYGCSRKVAIQKSHAWLKQDSSNVTVDTSKKTIVSTSTRTIKFGDSLKANVFVAYKDSNKTSTPFKIESQGISVEGLIEPSNNYGGFYIDLTAIAKPTESVSTETTEINDQKGVSNETIIKKEAETKEKNKVVETDNELIKGFVFIVFSLLGLWLWVQLLKKNHVQNTTNNG